MELKQMMEKLGQAKTHLELKKMIAEIDTDGSNTINYTEFLNMMLGKKNSILKMLVYNVINNTFSHTRRAGTLTGEENAEYGNTGVFLQ